jgi:hypothetical protein
MQEISGGDGSFFLTVAAVRRWARSRRSIERVRQDENRGADRWIRWTVDVMDGSGGGTAVEEKKRFFVLRWMKMEKRGRKQKRGWTVRFGVSGRVG